MSKSKVWMLSGSKDTIVVQGVVAKTYEYYTHYLEASHPPVFNNTLPAEHAWITGQHSKKRKQSLVL